MSQKRRQFSASFKTKVVLEALKEREALNELASRYEIQPNQITTWKKQALDNFSTLFDRNQSHSKAKAEEEEKRSLYEQIGQLKMECEWLKKKS